MFKEALLIQIFCLNFIKSQNTSQLFQLQLSEKRERERKTPLARRLERSKNKIKKPATRLQHLQICSTNTTRVSPPTFASNHQISKRSSSFHFRAVRYTRLGSRACCKWTVTRSLSISLERRNTERLRDTGGYLFARNVARNDAKLSPSGIRDTGHHTEPLLRGGRGTPVKLVSLFLAYNDVCIGLHPMQPSRQFEVVSLRTRRTQFFLHFVFLYSISILSFILSLSVISFASILRTYRA